RLAEAEADFRDALSVLERTRAQDDPLVARALMNVAGAQRRQGRPAEALPLLERAAGIYARKFGPAHPDTVAARAELDEARSEAGQLH
ncbi:MAG: tetratricopeptide repeat protein, partial [Actinobacteria bacterium]|nr:tetratricopeptide repeat protein [Actinomycetota bacterium]